MAEVTRHEPGTFCWVELGTTDPAAAKAFYQSLLDWETEDMPAGEITYTIARRRGKDVAGIYALPPEQRAQGVPPHWLSHVATDNADETVQRAEQLGATVAMPPFDVMDVGRMALLHDPSGALVSVWQPRRHIGAALINEHGALCWNELLTRDPDAARAFYTALFGWTPTERDMGPMGTYTVFKLGDRQVAGMMRLPSDFGEAPSQWGVYFAVDDVDVRADKAKERGAAITVPPSDIPDVGRFSMLLDPQGAALAMITLDPAPM
jgi:uncharacterized protein